MATDDWQPQDTLRQLSENPHRYDFFAALRLLDSCFTEMPRIGWSNRAHEEKLRLGQHPSLRFAPSAIGSFQWASRNQKWQMKCPFFGLFGPQGAMPTEMTEYVMARLRDHRDDTFTSFVDCFHHRMLSFYYRAYTSVEPTFQFDRPAADRVADYVGSLMGIGTDHYQQRDQMPDLAKLYYAGHLSQQNHHADGLRQMLADFFALDVEISQFVGQWLTIPKTNRLHLGYSPQTGTLGKTSTIGERIWECQQCVRIQIGPLSIDDYRRFLPGGAKLPVLRDLIRNYAGMVLDWQLKLIVHKQEVPSMQLGANVQLGWVSWLTQSQPNSDVDDLVLGSHHNSLNP